MRLFRLRLQVVSLAALTFNPHAAQGGTVPTRTESSILAWDYPPLPVLPLDAHFGATLSLHETLDGSAFVLIGAPGVAAAQLLELASGETLWDVQATVVSANPQPLPVAVDFYPLYALLNAGGATTSILRADTGVAQIAGIDGGPVATLVMSGTMLAFGQPEFFGGSGRVRIYEQAGVNSWILAETFVGGFGSRLGASLAADDTIFAAGAPNGGDNGRVHIFARTGAGNWIELQVIDSPATGQTGAEFGAAVALDGSHLVVGSPLLNRNSPPPTRVDVGAVYVYDALTFPFLQFDLQALLLPPDLASHDWFGTSVDLLVRTTGAVDLVAGAPGDDTGANNAGAVYRYRRTGPPAVGSWHEVSRLVSSQPVDLEQLGNTVGLGDIGVLAGAPYGQFGGGATSGLVLFFDHRLFADGFESGDLSAWELVFP